MILSRLGLTPSSILRTLGHLLSSGQRLCVPRVSRAIEPRPSFLLFTARGPTNLCKNQGLLSETFQSQFVRLRYGSLPDSRVRIVLYHHTHVTPSRTTGVNGICDRLRRHQDKDGIFTNQRSLIALQSLFH